MEITKEQVIMKFLEMWRDSTIIQGLVTLILISAITYMYLNRIEVPDTMVDIALIVIGFWFGQKGMQSQRNIIEKQLFKE